MTDLRTRILAGETLIGVFADLASPLAAELSGMAGFDWVVFDLEHGESTEADLLGLLYATGTTSMAAVVRPQSAERLRIGAGIEPDYDVTERAQVAQDRYGGGRGCGAHHDAHRQVNPAMH